MIKTAARAWRALFPQRRHFCSHLVTPRDIARATSSLRQRGVPSAWSAWTADTTTTLAERRLLRELRAVDPVMRSSSSVQMGNRQLTVFAANDYLGLSAAAEVRTASAAAALQYGSGPRSSALVCGYTPFHEELEASLAALKGSEDALLFPTGFAANMSVLGTLADGPGCAIFSDELNHASIVDGARLAARGAGASLHIYRHNDLNHLESLLQSSSAPRKLIISDSLFSMDGDLADCQGLATLRDQYGALLCLDEAHATLVYGENGGGVAEEQGVAEKVDVHVGTLSKAFGSHGGFVGCSSVMKRLLISKGRAGIYSTALPLPAVCAASTALRLATPERRVKLWMNVHTLETALSSSTTSTSTSSEQQTTKKGFDSPIVPYIVGTESAALTAADELREQGFLVPAIRPPTVPVGTARLRIALSAAHSEEDVLNLAKALKRISPQHIRRLDGDAEFARAPIDALKRHNSTVSQPRADDDDAVAPGTKDLERRRRVAKVRSEAARLAPTYIGGNSRPSKDELARILHEAADLDPKSRETVDFGTDAGIDKAIESSTAAWEGQKKYSQGEIPQEVTLRPPESNKPTYSPAKLARIRSRLAKNGF